MKQFKPLSIYFALLILVMASCSDDSGDNSNTDTIAIEVTAETTSIVKDATLQLTATFTPANTANQNVIWSSSNDEKATIDETGLVTGIAAGIVELTATSESDSSISGKMFLQITGPDANDLVSFTVGDRTATIENNEVNIEVLVGTDITKLIPTIDYMGAFISPAINTPQDFSEPVTYTITAENGDTQEFTVTITFTDQTIAGTEFITTWTGTYVYIPINTSYEYNYAVDWDNDGVVDESGITTATYHRFEDDGPHTIRITGTFPALNHQEDEEDEEDVENLIELNQWGTNKWLSLANAFNYCVNMEILATDQPDLSQAISTEKMFQQADKANPDVSNWDMSNITNMSRMFYYANMANPDVSNWDTSNVRDMSRMFSGISGNPDVSNWDTSKVTNMYFMFYNADNANPDVSNWDTSNVTNMGYMFGATEIANPDVSNWDTSNVTSMRFMFGGTTIANPDVSGWDTSKVTDMSYMFYNALVAEPNTTNWDTSSATQFYYMFRGAPFANPDTSNWDTSNVTTMGYMFYEAVNANPDTDNWEISKVTNFTGMFSGVTLPTLTYDKILISFAGQARQSDLSFDGGNSIYCSGTTARANLVSSTSWTITDGGQCPL
ncbi:BspA family leucine-rich repeat surface protein [Aquimarina pacifica]|uniref:BspA family leucine-rich repeat surface protein n=1 Tax=Aquimarina pacifica TaxID=1296415 RepID=UPI00046F8617|nr:BspA family leucine-rich repeat surface protein [Aquimarina pacifica]